VERSRKSEGGKELKAQSSRLKAEKIVDKNDRRRRFADEGIGIEEFENSDVRYSVRKRKGFPLIL
jgi:hypothetical protein